MGQTKRRVFNIEIEHNPYEVECCLARVVEHSHLLVHGVDEEEVKANIRDLIRCHLDKEEGEGAGDQTFTCIFHHK